MQHPNALGLTFAPIPELSEVASDSDWDSVTVVSLESIPNDGRKYLSSFHLNFVALRRWASRNDGRSHPTSTWRRKGSLWKNRICTTMKSIRRRLPVVLQTFTASIASNFSGAAAPTNNTVVPYPLYPVSVSSCAACQSTAQTEAENEQTIEVPCGHQYHVECLLTLVETSLQSLSSFPPRCCRQTVPTEAFEYYMHRSLQNAFAEREAEYNTPKRVYCANPRCSQFLGPRDIQFPVRILTCPDSACRTRTCARCKTRVDTPASKHECSHDPGHRVTLQLGSRLGWVRCPTCEELIERNGGCAHMTCVCGSQFCYRCGSLWGKCYCVDWRDDEGADAREARLFAPLEEGGDLGERLVLRVPPALERGANTSRGGNRWLGQEAQRERPRSRSFTLPQRDDTVLLRAAEANSTPLPLLRFIPPTPKSTPPASPRSSCIGDATPSCLPFLVDPTLVARGILAQESRRRRRATSL